jgi:hypothetical protein
MRRTSRYPERTKHGTIKEVVLYAQVNHLPAKMASRHFSVPVNSIYWAARRMGIKLKVVRPARKVTDEPSV